MADSKKWYALQPEVAGGLGEGTVVKHEPTLVVEELDYEFQGWLGDELLESTPCFIATSAVCDDIRASAVSGVSFRQCTISYDEQFEEMYPGRILPPFEWLVIEGRVRRGDDGKVVESTGHDANLDQQNNLVVSEKLLTVLKRHKLDACEIEPL